MGEPRAVMRTICPTCEGKGERAEYRAAVMRSHPGEMGTLVVMVKCKFCLGKGTLPGFQPPV